MEGRWWSYNVLNLLINGCVPFLGEGKGEPGSKAMWGGGGGGEEINH